jgi:hypothetical protein
MLMHDFSELSLEQLKDRSFYCMPLPFLRTYMNANVGKEIDKDRLIIEYAAARFREGRLCCDYDIGEMFEMTKQVDKAFLRKVNLPSLTITIRYEDIASIRKSRIDCLSRSVHDLLAHWKDDLPVEDASGRRTASRFQIEDHQSHLYNQETRQLSNSIPAFGPSDIVGLSPVLCPRHGEPRRVSGFLYRGHLRREGTSMTGPDLILMHPPSVFRFREMPLFFGPVSDVVPSTSVFEIYPIGFLTISDYLTRRGMSVRIVNLALKMLQSSSFDPASFIKNLKPSLAFGIDLHWLPHVDGSLSLAELAKKHHPHVPVILGGLSASYYYEEIMRDYPFVDFIVRGESTEEPLRQLLCAIRSGNGFESVPNLVWRTGAGKIMVNPLSFQPANLDYVRFDYSHLLRMAIKYLDPSGYIPFKYWSTYPVTAVFSCRGCWHNCGTCGGSVSAFRNVCRRSSPCFRSPELVVDDIKRVSEFTGAPVMVLGDVLQAGKEYSRRFLAAMRRPGSG